MAPRAGTPGFRAPEVLTKCPNQGTGWSLDVWRMMHKHNIFTRFSLLPLSYLLYRSHRRVVSWCDPALTAQRPLSVLQSQWWPARPHSDHDHKRLKRDYPGCQGIWCVVVFFSCADWSLCFLLELQCFTTDPHCHGWNQQGSLGFITYLTVVILRGKEGVETTHIQSTIIRRVKKSECIHI